MFKSKLEEARKKARLEFISKVFRITNKGQDETEQIWGNKELIKKLKKGNEIEETIKKVKHSYSLSNTVSLNSSFSSQDCGKTEKNLPLRLVNVNVKNKKSKRSERYKKRNKKLCYSVLCLK